MDPDKKPKSTIATASSILTLLAHGSAPFISTFLLVHLSAPIVANIGGSGLASSVMLLGREYYQTALGERYLLLLPFTVHVTSSVAKRVVLTLAPTTPSSSTTDEQKDSPQPLSRPTLRIRRLASLLSVSAYTALLIFVPIHVVTHRLLPASPLTGPSMNSEDTDALGPSELDFEFVKTALHTWPLRSWILYAGLVGCVLVHATEGASVILARWKGRGATGGRSGFSGKKRARLVAGAAALPVLSGLWVMSREPLLALSSLVGRYQATLMGSWAYRL